jgi:6-phosphogluconolactonase/glucosamine-6-phosphate isomerase/deaminase
MAVEFVTYETEQRAAEALYNELRNYLEFGPERHNTDKMVSEPFVIMLAGGSTPLKVYQRVADNLPRRVHPAAHLLLSDDRYVPEIDSQSNFGTIRPMATKLGIEGTRFVHADTALPEDKAVADFGRNVVDLGARSAVFSLGILGIGTDGHTASLFTPSMVTLPGKDATSENPAAGDGTLLTSQTDRAAIATGVHGGVSRISLGAEVLLSFQKLVFFATGQSKREILYELSRRPEQYPAGLIMLNHPNAHIWTDEAPRVK